MPPRSISLALLLLFAASLPVKIARAELAPIAGPIQVRVPAPDGPESRSPATFDVGKPRPGGSSLALYPTYLWPMEHGVGDGVFCANFIDEDPTAGIRDYMNGTWTYDTHAGTDISLLDFKAMDRGSRIVAAAAGTVTAAVWANTRDRNCDQPDNPTLNYIEVANGDGTYTYYLHLRANSMTVNVGENVVAGQVLGMAGSSGYSFGPHLHFEAADWLGGPYTVRDPWAGPGNPRPGLWAAQYPYPANEPFQAFDAGVFSVTALGGDFDFDYCSTFAERVQETLTFGLAEPYVGVWLYPQGRTGTSYRVEIEQPDHALYASVDFTLTEDTRGGYHLWAWNWSPYVTQTGTWKARVKRGSTVLQERTFTVAATTTWKPRLVRGGRSFRIDGSVQRDTLHVKPLGGAGVSYALVGAPGFVSLADSIVTVGAASTQPNRSTYFQVVATSPLGARDTAWYHVVDPTKPPNPLVSVDPLAVRSELALATPFPNPSAGPVDLHFAIPRTGRASLALYDVAGRCVGTLVDEPSLEAGTYTVHWDGRDAASGAAAAPGLYFARLRVEGTTATTRIVRSR